jgi:hypothetical protein
MTQIHPTLLLLLIEAVAVLLLVQTVWLVLAWLRRRREHKAVQALIAALEKDAEARSRRNAAAIGRTLSLEGEALATRVTTVEEAQKLLLKSVVLGWTRRDAASIARLQEPVEALSAGWREALAAAGSESAEQPEVAAELAARVQELERENVALTQGLKNSRDTMNRMLSEYAAMYQRGDSEDDSTARRVLRGDAIDRDALTAAQIDPQGDVDVESSGDNPPQGAPADPARGATLDGKRLDGPAPAAPACDAPAGNVELAMAEPPRQDDCAGGAEHAADDNGDSLRALADPAGEGTCQPSPRAREIDRDDAADVQSIQDELESLFDSADDLDYDSVLKSADDDDPFDALELTDDADDDDTKPPTHAKTSRRH